MYSKTGGAYGKTYTKTFETIRKFLMKGDENNSVSVVCGIEMFEYITNNLHIFEHEYATNPKKRPNVKELINMMHKKAKQWIIHHKQFKLYAHQIELAICRMGINGERRSERLRCK